MMQLLGTRFGNIEVEDNQAIEFPRGLIGFGGETQFVLLRPRPGSSVGWLQSIQTPALSLPVISASVFGGEYPTPSPAQLANDASLEPADGTNVAVLVVVAARPAEPRLVANLLAPIVVDVGHRRGAQVVLDPRKYSASTPMVS